MKCSFIIPSFNQGRFIRQCLDSIIAQKLPSGTFEVIVIDGGSVDDSVSIIASHPVVTEWVSEPDRGHWDAVNKGIERSSGELIAWINSDDYYLPAVFGDALAYIDQYPDAGIYYGDGDEVDIEGVVIQPYQVEEWDYERLIDRCILSQPAVLVRREVFDAYGLLSGECQVALDLEYWLRVGRSVCFKRMPLKLACSRIWDGTKSSNQQLGMQQDALYYGRLHGGRWSRRRLGATAECRMLKQFPRMSSDTKGISFLMFHLLRAIFFSRLYLQCRFGRFDPRSNGY